MRDRFQVLTSSIVIGVIAGAVLAEWFSTSAAQQAPQRQLPEYTASGDLVLPKNWREWVFVGDPLTPIALNGGKKCPEPATAADQPCTGFPEYHNVYIEPGSYAIYQRTNQFPDQTIIFKELQLSLPAQNPDGSRMEASGRGFFPGAFNGADVTVKDTRRFPNSGGWGYVNFNHHEPKAPTGKVTDCGYACHLGGAKKDEVWTQFYQILDK